MASVTLIEYTGKGRTDEKWHAADLLIFTKSTRLNLEAGLLGKIKGETTDWKIGELEYMAGTIPSSWEFVDLTFLVSGVSRASAQQITRTRTASYAMQSQRVTDVREAAVVSPYQPGDEFSVMFGDAVASVMDSYENLLDAGAAPQDARGVLPMNIECNLLCKYNLRSFVELIRARSSLRVQGEYSDIADQMKALVLEAWPWAAPFFTHPNDRAIGMLERVVEDMGLQTGKGAGWEIAKAIDLLRKG